MDDMNNKKLDSYKVKIWMSQDVLFEAEVDASNLQLFLTEKISAAAALDLVVKSIDLTPGYVDK